MEENSSFAAKYDFPFPLLSDPNREVCMAYGACDGPGNSKARRFTYVIGPDGKILEVIKDVKPDEHAEALLNLPGGSARPAQQEPPSSMDQGVQVVQHDATIKQRRARMHDEENATTEIQPATSADVEPDAGIDPSLKLDVQAAEERTSAAEEIISDLEADPTSATAAAVEVVPSADSEPPSKLDGQVSEDRTFPAEGIISDIEVDIPSPVITAADTAVSLEHEVVASPSQVQPAQASSSGGGGRSLVYALGTVGYDFGSEARKDSFAQAMGNGGNPQDSSQLLAHLAEHPYAASSITWTLSLDATPIYAIKPGGAFADVAYERLREFLSDQLSAGVQRVSIPGITGGRTRLMSGQIVPAIVPALRGMYNWSTDALVEAVLGEAPEDEGEGATYEQKREGISNFLERIYYELRNLGTASQERAMNFAATNAFQVTQIFQTAVNEEMELDKIGVEASPICRPGSDCWDVKLIFFEPGRRLERARKVYRFTVDVSDVVPVTVGTVRSWSIY